MATNRIVALLTEQDRNRLLQDAVVTYLPLKKELYQRGHAIDAIYFPIDCVVSIVVGAGEGALVEMATVGREGVVGVFTMLNVGKALGTNVVQVAGEALRLDARVFHNILQDSAAFCALMQKYLFALIHQMMQVGACNQMHAMEERCARWLLMMHDRSGGASFMLTQEFLSEMLGVRRASVNVAIGMLKTAGFITYVRGRITVLDRAGLESAACPCYELIRREYRELRLE